MSYAVIDFETTGFMPERSDRVLEIGVVLTDGFGNAQEEWTTLVNPKRDIGATHIHGITGADLLDAPDFGDVANYLLTLLAGRTIVAHNASFDMRFLHAELLRVGFDLPSRPAALCSMKWAGRMIGAAKLEHCCEALDIELLDAHTALADARATAALVRHLQPLASHHPDWHSDASTSAAFPWPAFTPFTGTPPSIQRRSAGSEEGVWLEKVLNATWIPGGNEDEAAYLLTLDRALLDREVSATEGRELLATAEEAGLSGETITRLHLDYLRSVATEALADEIVTEEEREDLLAVAQLLGFPEEAVDEALAWAASEPAAPTSSGFALEPGDRVVFTGTLTKGRSEWLTEIVAAGLVSGGITKSTKVLVSADPDSMSGKAKKARDYGIPVIGEEAFSRFFESYLSQRGSPTTP